MKIANQLSRHPPRLQVQLTANLSPRTSKQRPIRCLHWSVQWLLQMAQTYQKMFQEKRQKRHWWKEQRALNIPLYKRKRGCYQRKSLYKPPVLVLPVWWRNQWRPVICLTFPLTPSASSPQTQRQRLPWKQTHTSWRPWRKVTSVCL